MESPLPAMCRPVSRLHLLSVIVVLTVCKRMYFKTGAKQMVCQPCLSADLPFPDHNPSNDVAHTPVYPNCPQTRECRPQIHVC